MRFKYLFSILIMALLSACVSSKANFSQTVTQESNFKAMSNGLPAIDLNSAIYELPVKEGVSYQDILDSLKSLSAGMNLVNSGNIPISEYMKLRGIDPQGIKDVHTICNLSMGIDVMLDHPEFLVFAPCRIAVYEKLDANNKLTLFLGLDRPTYDLKSIKNPTVRAQKSAQELEDALIRLMEKASRGDI